MFYLKLIYRICVYDLYFQGSFASLDIAFAFDSSDNVQLETFNRMKEFSTKIVNSFRVSSKNARFASLTFSSQAAVDFTFDQYENTAEINQAIGRIGHQRRPANLKAAFELLKSDVFSLHGGIRTSRPKVLVLFYNGNVVLEEAELRSMVSPLVDYGVRIVVVGMVNGGNVQVDMKQLNLIAQSSSTVFVGTFDELKREIYLIGSEISRG